MPLLIIRLAGCSWCRRPVAVNFEEHINARKRERHFPVYFCVRKRRNTRRLHLFVRKQWHAYTAYAHCTFVQNVFFTRITFFKVQEKNMVAITKALGDKSAVRFDVRMVSVQYILHCGMFAETMAPCTVPMHNTDVHHGQHVLHRAVCVLKSCWSCTVLYALCSLFSRDVGWNFQVWKFHKFRDFFEIFQDSFLKFSSKLCILIIIHRCQSNLTIGMPDFASGRKSSVMILAYLYFIFILFFIPCKSTLQCQTVWNEIFTQRISRNFPSLQFRQGVVAL